MLRYRRKSTVKNWFTVYRQKLPSTLIPYKNYRQLSYPIKTSVNTAYRIKNYRQYCIPPERYRQLWIPPKRHGLFFLVFSFSSATHHIVGSHIHILWLQVTCNTCDILLSSVISQRMMYYVLHVYVLLSSHQIRLVYIRRNSLVHTCFVFGQNYSRGRVDLWPESTHAHTSATTTPTRSPAHITFRVVEQNNEPFRGKPQRC